MFYFTLTMLQGHVVWSQWKGEQGLSIMLNTNACLIYLGSDDDASMKDSQSFRHPKYSADHGPLLHIYAGHVI